ncbi:50S ribosomal protein L18 [Candidatus Giovannonibacteria bacterium RIFCSPHIGHO2_02_FULL_46_20]|uniref:Large ribosomal subunit protein uL18 n=1 Tax=Candidatus Giovannonibacteria bacterium RIFCSPHIGHO2_02_FULL_46_20 TaxID=1798338 RepID=A0A1F5WFT0_9BACT|nr:MAG: 50S ribosomal protein L18 [Candidatus Giovannonibacteria bacterium RIFCSPHIGHO2_02_FULL_46_20]
MITHATRQYKRVMRHRRIRAMIQGTVKRPRFSVYRSHKHIMLQLIDDEKGKTLLGISDRGSKKTKARTKSQRAFEAGKLLAQKAKTKGIESVVFDRGGYKYHGRVAKAAEGAREGGLKF